jgi:hypothetical protein
LKPPLLSKNTAREYLKTLNVTGRFCVVSLPADWRDNDAKSVLDRVAERYPHWYFIVLNDALNFNGRFQELPRRVFLPSRAGFDLLTRLCISAEADAYVGADDIYGLTAYLSGKPVHLLGDAQSSVSITAALPNVDFTPRYSRELLSQSIERLLSQLEMTHD